MASRFWRKPTPDNVNEIDQATVEIIKGINDLILQAQANNLTVVSSVLEEARESIAWWAAYDDYNHSCDEAAAEHLKLSSGLNVAATLLAKLSVIKDEQIRKEMLDLIRGVSS